MECVGLIVCRPTMAFVQSSRPILVMSAECICSLLIYILVKLIPVDIWDPTITFSDFSVFFQIFNKLQSLCMEPSWDWISDYWDICRMERHFVCWIGPRNRFSEECYHRRKDQEKNQSLWSHCREKYYGNCWFLGKGEYHRGNSRSIGAAVRVGMCLRVDGPVRLKTLGFTILPWRRSPGIFESAEYIYCCNIWIWFMGMEQGGARLRWYRCMLHRMFVWMYCVDVICNLSIWTTFRYAVCLDLRLGMPIPTLSSVKSKLAAWI